MKLQLIDPAHIKLLERKQLRAVQTAVAEQQPLDAQAQRELLIQQLLDQTFAIDNRGLREYVYRALRGGRRVSTKHLPVDSAQDLLAVAHVVEAGSVNSLSSEHQFVVAPTGLVIENTEYYHAQDEFTIELTSNDN